MHFEAGFASLHSKNPNSKCMESELEVHSLVCVTAAFETLLGREKQGMKTKSSSDLKDSNWYQSQFSAENMGLRTWAAAYPLQSCGDG